ncbi:hypothetical protein GCM10018793_68450 [Streptomyces sulfonofaciens]|uniref:Uncharacterized protein n=1 Tax=Streptomyces sulfonofaciens TaxID=68272 RepID=A0A919LC59_9ACTN|nr:hypothetical protein [Streptomyces sulfonofaciens]GHH88511.1 hypothetical protein GCM10018793_68450 [Streptomyces sulfonofaciens]
MGQGIPSRNSPLATKSSESQRASTYPGVPRSALHSLLVLVLVLVPAARMPTLTARQGDEIRQGGTKTHCEVRHHAAWRRHRGLQNSMFDITCLMRV